jgi:hypothetical protein
MPSNSNLIKKNVFLLKKKSGKIEGVVDGISVFYFLVFFILILIICKFKN